MFNKPQPSNSVIKGHLSSHNNSYEFKHKQQKYRDFIKYENLFIQILFSENLAGQ